MILHSSLPSSHDFATPTLLILWLLTLIGVAGRKVPGAGKKYVTRVGFRFRVGKYRAGEGEATLVVLGLRVGKYHGGINDDIVDLGFCINGLLRSNTSCELEPTSDGGGRRKP